MFHILVAIPTNLLLVTGVLLAVFPDPFYFTLAAVTVMFIELMKTLFLATSQHKAMLEFGVSLVLLLTLSLYIQSQNDWGRNFLTICALIQVYDTLGGFIGTFLLARRDFGH